MEVRRALRRGRNNRPSFLNRSRFTGDGLYNWNTVSDMLPECLRLGGGGFVFFGGGFAKRGVRPNPPNPLVTGLVVLWIRPSSIR